jgi:hypothetical protein
VASLFSINNKKGKEGDNQVYVYDSGALFVFLAPSESPFFCPVYFFIWFLNKQEHRSPKVGDQVI